MKDLQLVLFVLGAIAIIAVLVHGFWSIRKQQPKSTKQSPMAGFYKDQAQRRDSEGFDADGIGAVRVRKAGDVDEPAIKSTLKNHDTSESAPTTHVEPTLSHTSSKDSLTKPGATQPTKTTQPTQQTLFIEDEEDIQAPTPSNHSHASMNTPKKIVNASTTRGPLTSYSGVTASAYSAVSSPKNEPQKTVTMESAKPAETAEPEVSIENEPVEPTDVLVLHVVAKAGEQVQGAELLPSLLSLHFKFGDMDIFHRHIDNAGTGKVLFSVANMLKPGVFDPDNMEQFETQGVVLFMTLPCYGDPLMNFTIMLNSAYQIAEDLGAELLDGQRQPWSEEIKKDYLRRLNAA
ncbi:cell division protein ZipA [Shewanella polaris]|uniref:Cell division protein ZipA n=1 Tax=Shewanella polaris TaxID=2588449 RepID=A0A4Y5YDQ9_9GAMM|nr:cell division protein ZipA [Shewanella polaris]QDE30814.1 cell division protein ZipA [Shewanella polaris]